MGIESVNPAKVGGVEPSHYYTDEGVEVIIGSIQEEEPLLDARGYELRLTKKAEANQRKMRDPLESETLPHDDRDYSHHGGRQIGTKRR